MFTETLKLDLKLTIDTFNLKVPGGNIKNFDIAIHSYGMEAKVDFWISTEYTEDVLLPLFTQPTLIKAFLSIRGCNLPAVSPDPLIVQGIVTYKALCETVLEGDKTALFRRYTIHFVDAACVLWRQHFPLNLYADGKMEDVIKRHIASGISLVMDWAPLQVVHPIICLSMGDTKSRTSFYDFIMWYVDTNNGVWSYDHHNNIYKLSGQKESEGLLPTFMDFLDVERLEVNFPETPRHKVVVLNSYAEAAKRQDVANEQAVEGVRRDVLTRSEVASDLPNRATLETSRLKVRQPEVFLEFRRFPNITFRIGKFFRFEKGGWDLIFPFGKEYRVCEIKFVGKAVDQNAQTDRDVEKTGYNLEMTSQLEAKDELDVRLPPYTPPYYPIYAEAKMLSAEGEPFDKTYQFIEDSNSSLHFYKVLVPIWNQTIIIPYNPNSLPGHLYFPIYKNARLLLSIYFYNAEIDRMLDWGPDVRLPLETQGNHLLFGKNSLSQTSLKHVYEDGLPSLYLRRTSQNDTQFFQITEGSMVLQAYEEQGMKTTQETYDLTPRAELAKGELNMKAQSAMGEFSAESATSKAAVAAHLGTAVSQVTQELETMDKEISDKANSVKSELKSATSQLDQKTAAVRRQVESVKTELRARLQ